MLLCGSRLLRLQVAKQHRQGRPACRFSWKGSSIKKVVYVTLDQLATKKASFMRHTCSCQRTPLTQREFPLDRAKVPQGCRRVISNRNSQTNTAVVYAGHSDYAAQCGMPMRMPYGSVTGMACMCQSWVLDSFRHGCRRPELCLIIGAWPQKHEPGASLCAWTPAVRSV